MVSAIQIKHIWAGIEKNLQEIKEIHALETVQQAQTARQISDYIS